MDKQRVFPQYECEYDKSYWILWMLSWHKMDTWNHGHQLWLDHSEILMKNQFQNSSKNHEVINERDFIILHTLFYSTIISIMFKSVHQIWMKFPNMIGFLSMVSETQITISTRVRFFSGMIGSNMALCIGGWSGLFVTKWTPIIMWTKFDGFSPAPWFSLQYMNNKTIGEKIFFREKKQKLILILHYPGFTFSIWSPHNSNFCSKRNSIILSFVIYWTS